MILLSRVVTRLGAVEHINPKVIESLYAADLAYLQDLYNRINHAEDETQHVELSAVPARLRDGAARGGGVLGYPLERLYQEVAYVAYHFHWPQSEVLALEHADRRRWVQEIAGINRQDERMMASCVRLRTASRIGCDPRGSPRRAAAGRFAHRLSARHLRRGAAQRTLELLLCHALAAFAQNVLQRYDVQNTAPSIVLLAHERLLQRPPRAGTRTAAPDICGWSRRDAGRESAKSARQRLHVLLHLVQSRGRGWRPCRHSPRRRQN